MTDRDDNLKDTAWLLFSAIEGTISKTDFARLEKRLQEDPAARDEYFHLLKLTIALNDSGGILSLKNAADPSGSIDLTLWQALARQEDNAPGIPQARPAEQQTDTIVETGGITPPASPLKLYIFSAVALVAIAIIGLFMPSAQPVGVLTDMAEAQWSVNGIYPTVMTRLYPGKMELTGGFAQITLNNGTKVLLQAPAIFELRDSDDSLYLESGRLTASVPTQAIGFTIETPYARIIDHGTEFGVVVREGDSVGTHVFDGKVMVSSKDPSGEEMVSWLTRGQAIAVDEKGAVSEKFPTEAREFIREIKAVDNWKPYLNINLVANPGFEADAPGIYDKLQAEYSQQITDISISGWQDTGPATIYTYYSDPAESFPQPTRNKLPEDCGNNFFIGVETGQISQTINVSELGYAIDNLGVEFSFSAWLGGFMDHSDKLEIIARFRDKNNKELSSITLGPVTPQERDSQTGFVYKSRSGLIPAGADHIEIIISTQRQQGIADAYADNIELSLKVR
ncbi:MAG: FecR domain-containing protein [Sedimentisphaerales bacterium]|nr:FecR domain-containing protein [Sedimentisphaerales bacterium]